MLSKMLALLKKYRGLITYLIFGVLTTVVNYIVYLPLFNLAGLSAAMSNAAAWVVAVLFAYVTNKIFVFESRDWSPSAVLPEFAKFVGCRAASGAAETLILWLAVDCLHRDGNIWKLLTSILVVILNYVASKLFVFRKGSNA